MAKICLLTPGQPSTNPRLLKEADALVEAGHQVEVICAHWAAWADETDRALLQSRRFTCAYVGGHPRHNPQCYAWTRLRHKLGRMLAPRLAGERTTGWALCRVTPELIRAAEATRADLYIAHNLGALPAAIAAARKHQARAGFDAEDFHSGMQPDDAAPGFAERLIEVIERQCLPACDYVTAASPLIAEAYEMKYGMVKPTTILNVFSLAQRPRDFRVTRTDGPLSLYWFSQTIGAKRGLEDVIGALGHLSNCDIQLHLCGQWQAGFRENLFKLAQAVGFNPERIHHHHPVNPDEMIGLSSQFDVGLATEPGHNQNNRIAVSNKLFTYLLAGNVVAATRTEGQRLFIEATAPAMRGYDPGDVKTLAEIFKQWYDDRSELETARRQAWAWGESCYNWDVEKGKFLDLIASILSSSEERRFMHSSNYQLVNWM